MEMRHSELHLFNICLCQERPAGREAGTGVADAGQSHVPGVRSGSEADQKQTAPLLLYLKQQSTSGPTRRSRRQQRCCSPGPRRAAGVQLRGDP